MGLRAFAVRRRSASLAKAIPDREDAYSRNFVLPAGIVLAASILLLNVGFPTSLRLPLFLAVCFVAMRSVYGTFLVFPASVVIPDAGFGSLTATQVALVVWLISWLLWQRNHRFYVSRTALIPVAVFAFWLAVSAYATSDATTLLDLLKAVSVGFATYHMLRLKDTRIELCLLGMVLASSLAAVQWYLGFVLHIPGFEGENIRIAVFESVRSGGIRYATIKQDPNTVSILLNFALWGAVNLAIYARSLTLSRWRGPLLVLGVTMVPPLINAESRAGYLVFLLSALETVGFLALVRQRRSHDPAPDADPVQRPKRKGRRWNPVWGVLVLLVFALLVAAITYMPAAWQARINATVESIELRGLDDRADRMATAWRVIQKSPIIGVGVEEFFQQYSDFAAHNAFLDLGVAAGVPGMLLFLGVVALPLVLCLSRLRRLSPAAVVAIVGYLVIVTSMLSLSISGDKLFWMLWAALLYLYETAAVVDPTRAETTRKRRTRRFRHQVSVLC